MAPWHSKPSLEAERNGDKSHEDHQTAIREVPKPTESEHVRQRDKKPHAGPPSLRQRRLRRGRTGVAKGKILFRVPGHRLQAVLRVSKKRSEMSRP